MTHIFDLYLSRMGIKHEEDVGRKKEEILKKIMEGKDIRSFYPTKREFGHLPQNSALIKISFKLRKPYTSKDEGEFHVIFDGERYRTFDNPMVRDIFLGCAMVRPSTWKGHLRFAAEKVETVSGIESDDEKRKVIIKRLFGADPDDGDSLKGRLYFFPTFFEGGGGRDVITPLDREKRIPTKGPIFLEVVKAGGIGDFHLLYVPYPKGNDFKEEQIKEDLIFLINTLKSMFYTYGFSAKKTSGYGVIERRLEKGGIWIKIGTDVKEKNFSEIDELRNRLIELWRENNE